jgi:hypothetical protein
MTTSTGTSRKFWTPAEEAHLRQHYADTLTVDLAPLYGRTIKQVLAKANALGLRKSVELISATARERSTRPDHGGRKTQFGPGHPPANKGLRRPGWAPGNMGKTQFKPGQKPHTWLPVGSTRIVDDQLQLKVNDSPGPNSVRWHPMSRVVWERTHGPVPAGHKVVFRPGRATTDAALITLDAVECISDAELMRRNSIHTNYPPELAEIARLRGTLTRVINRKSKEFA